MMELMAARWRVFYREPGALVWSLAFPLIAAGALMALTGAGRDPAALFPALLASSLFMSAMWGIGWAVVQTRTRGLFRRLLVTPVPRTSILASFAVQRIVLSAAEALLLCAVARIALGVALPAGVLAVPLAAAAFSALALAAVATAPGVESAIGRLNAFTLPLLAATGAIIPLPDALGPVAAVTPVALAASAISGSLLACAGLLAWTAAAAAWAIARFRWD
jgi:ABC-2 type transport system permease protein